MSSTSSPQDADVSRYLFVIPHYYSPVSASEYGSERDRAEDRARLVAQTVTALHETFGRVLSVFPAHRTAETSGNVVDVVLVTTRSDHLVGDLGDVSRLVTHEVVACEPRHLGFEAHRVLAGALGAYERYAFLEDDLAVRDPLLFAKQDWFSGCFGSSALLAPIRFEAGGGLKVHPDGPLGEESTAGLGRPPGAAQVTGRWLDLELVFARPSNPHSGCFFLDQDQMARLSGHPRLGRPHVSFVGPLETAASGPVAETFAIYKASPPRADFLEVEHQGTRYLEEWGLPDGAHVGEAARVAAEVRADEAQSRELLAAAEAGRLLARAEAAEVALRDVRSQLEELRASSSWRVTAPLRRFSEAVGRERPRLEG